MEGNSQTRLSVTEVRAEQDSALKGYTLEELEQYNRLYSREITRLQRENVELRRQGIREAELFLTSNPASKDADKIILQLAELYYDQSQDYFQIAMQEFDSLSAQYQGGKLSAPPSEPKKDFRRPIELYYHLIQHYPASALADDATYNLALLLEETGQADSAFVFYETILEEYPNTPLKPDVLMRIGEYYFNPPNNMIDQAIHYFEQLLQYRDSPRYDEALYRLGWCYYRRNQYANAISYFTLLVDDITRTKPYDPFQRYSNPSLVEEAIEYIGLCFLDYGGVEKAAQYIDDIGGRPYGVNVLKRLGDAYMDEKEDYARALKTYQVLLRMYPFDAMAPAVQNRVVQTYRRMEDQSMAFFARDLLFQQYREGSEWWQKNNDKEARRRALIFVESALRDNITVLINRAQDSGQKEFYRQAVAESHKYLDYFPNDSLSAMIHWNLSLILDTKLNKEMEAYEEYIKISQSYLNTKYQQHAAENAVVLAREAADRTASQSPSTAPSVHIEDLRIQFGTVTEKILKFREKMRIQPIPLSREQERLAKAYDNYFTLFPHGSETPIFLANAGTLYYRHFQFREALKYYNTLLKHFPDSEEAHQVRFAVMESYFGKADFRSCEIVARRILYSDASDEIKTKARRRMSEAIFLGAELLADGSKHLEAGNEYRRMARENPGGPFVDLALFNAALEYEKAHEFNRAIEAYNYLLAYYPQSSFVHDAQNNLAFDYAELYDYRNAALTYERVAAAHPDPVQARDALYNAGLYFSQLGDYQNAIRIHKNFSKKYSHDDLADDLAFEIAHLYQALDEDEQAQQAYQQFVEDYPHLPRAVEAYYVRSTYFLKKGDAQKASDELQKAIACSKELERMGQDRNDYFAAEAEFSLAMIHFAEFVQIQFQLPGKTLQANKVRKKELLQQIVHHLGNCAAYGTTRVYEATYYVGRTYQEFAQTWESQQIPSMEPNRKIIAQKDVYDASVLLYNRSAKAFYQGVVVLTRLAEAYRRTLQAGSDSLTARPTLTGTVASDSLSRLADKWIGQCKEGLAEVKYCAANVFYKSAIMVMDAPVPHNMEALQALTYRKRILEVGGQPLLKESMVHHLNNMQVADSLRILSEWITLSQQKAFRIPQILQRYYSSLAMDALQLLEQKMVRYAGLLYSRRRSEDQLNQLSEYSDLLTSAVNFARNSMIRAVDCLFEDLLDGLENQARNSMLSTNQDSLILAVVTFAEKSDSLVESTKARAHEMRGKFIRTQNPVYEQALFTFEKIHLALSEAEKEIVQQAYTRIKEFQVNNVLWQMMLLHLAKFEPDRYVKVAALEIKQQVISTDTTWRSHSVYVENWTGPEVDDHLWSPAAIISEGNASIPAIWIHSGRGGIPQVDSAADTQTSSGLVYFRRTFHVNGWTVACRIKFRKLVEMNVYMNGALVKKYSVSDVGKEDEIDISGWIDDGANVLALEAGRNTANEGGIAASITCRWIADWHGKMARLRQALSRKD
ncbi:tetratricopeptide repeat protein [candidate division KSB1 bacterium]|nr:tetratricopeptide repeat protein [candidate division KSB1 bacterium]